MQIHHDKPDYDVVVVGYGPVGQALTALLGARGHRVAVVERWPELFPLPRAGHVDHEIMRILQSIGVAEAVDEDSRAISGNVLIGADGSELHSFGWGFEGSSGWHSDYSLFQPYLESLLHGTVSRLRNVDLLRGWSVDDVAQDAHGVRVQCRPSVAGGAQAEAPTTLTARYVVGCDGANSVVRQSSGLVMADFGFEADWLVVFVEPHELLEPDGPDLAQVLDPARPTTVIRSSGKRFRRWEFMLMPGESPEQMSTPEVAWKLIGKWGSNPQNSRLVRNTVFRFRSLVADRWRAGRAFVAGDAAHLMPPFLGQGLCSGLRDAVNLAWKLDLVLREVAPDALLDSYDDERRPHASAVVRASLALGEFIAETDPVKAAARDARFRAGGSTLPGPLPGLVAGVLLRDAQERIVSGAGELSVQPRITCGEFTGRVDDLVGAGWRVFCRGWDAEQTLTPAARAVLDQLDARVVRIESVGSGADIGDAKIAAEVSDVFSSWLSVRVGAAGAVIVRPDFYTFAVVADADELDSALGQLAIQLGLEALPSNENHQRRKAIEV